jgi:hypothetical protein
MVSTSPKPFRGGTFLMTPAQHRARADELRKRPSPAACDFARQHDVIAQAIEKQQELAAQVPDAHHSYDNPLGSKTPP